MSELDAHCQLALDPKVREAARQRLISIRGHVEGILRMLEREDIYCVDVLRQLKAVDGAVAKVGDAVLRSHLHHHVTSAQSRGDADEMVDELMEILKYR
ncbi:metal-sensing transcriptional repressor [Spiribacter sp. C176]|uniref:Copper-sensing transcriptional repressor CsoR n=1 Tax=Spiribacter salilacus TaxID=2664894 RepID=A0A6N7QTN9_9GAMM|nr:metal-sensitive transcriptional regulator [Spiribacter salilacus]MRH78960.1 metal-sensing transcriptional repressor [Spiribacter salilacus]